MTSHLDRGVGGGGREAASRRDGFLILSGSEVVAVQQGRKTQHRVVLKLPPKQFEHPQMGGWEPTVIGGGGCFRIGRGGERIPVPETVGIWHRTSGYCAEAPYQVSDRLWVRETWCRDAAQPHGTLYRADGAHVVLDDGDGFAATRRDGSERSPWRSPTHMPRALSRLTLIVENVKVERLADITDADARAEGFEAFGPDVACPYQDAPTGDAADAFAAYWDSLHGKGAFESSPWVAALTFRVIPKNIDTLGGTP